MIAGAQLGVAGSAGATPTQDDGCGEDDEYLTVVQVAGRMDEVLVDFVRSEIEDVQDTCAVAVLLQVDSSGAVGSTDGMEDLRLALEESAKPVAVWVGQGGRARGEAVTLLALSDQTGMSAESHLEVTDELVEARGLDPADLETVRVGDTVGAERAEELDLVDSYAPVLIDFVGAMPEVETQVVEREGRTVQEPTTPVLFRKLPLTGQVLHTVASAPVAYLLFVIGLALLLFELYSVGVGIAGLVGGCSLVLGCYGLASLPTNSWAVGMLLVAFFGYAVDVQSGVPRVWTGIGTALFALGSLRLYDGMSVGLITFVAAFAGMTVFMLRGMPVMVRSRFSTVSLGRDWLVGEFGTAAERFDPLGTVIVRGAPWMARLQEPDAADEPDGASVRGDVQRGTDVEVVGTDGLVLCVERSGTAGEKASSASPAEH